MFVDKPADKMVNKNDLYHPKSPTQKSAFLVSESQVFSKVYYNAYKRIGTNVFRL